MFVDATAAIGVFQRIGLGKLRHLATQSLWLQEAVRDNRIGLSNVHGPVNPADLMTKHVDHATQIRLLGLMSVEARAGRAETAPEIGVCTEQVCSVDSGRGGDYNDDCNCIDGEEEFMDWFQECVTEWGEEVYSALFGRRRAAKMHKVRRDEP